MEFKSVQKHVHVEHYISTSYFKFWIRLWTLVTTLSSRVDGYKTMLALEIYIILKPPVSARRCQTAQLWCIHPCLSRSVLIHVFFLALCEQQLLLQWQSLPLLVWIHIDLIYYPNG